MSQMIALRRLLKSGLTIYNRKGAYCQSCNKGKRALLAHDPCHPSVILESRQVTCSACNYEGFCKDYNEFKSECARKYRHINGGLLIYQYNPR